ncbi:hypothetical protein NBH00_07900 [Paraconexibacter antarcticus]|uniref:Uncharacterized protein n=1 Tax=Paraconexibacter antarcticus TaxID=2949664 RepID=A0ABY5DZS2_9ACTN|nr:hypothetical protein [Paraconexibacter antarcticus]UTI66117.1 hypothetical protein NBH00_07900 [Paraconexibacter antarcticus]
MAGRGVAYAYVPALAVVAAVRGFTGLDLAHRWASSPRLVAEGRVWTLLSSALVLDRVQALQLVAVAILTAILIHRHGPGAWWTALLLGHVGSTLVAYAGTGVLWEVGGAFRHAEVNADFGISCVWMTIVGLLVCDGALTLSRSRRSWTVAFAATVLALAVTVDAASTISEVEHALAAIAGFGTVVWKRRPVTRMRLAPAAGPAAQPATA